MSRRLSPAVVLAAFVLMVGPLVLPAAAGPYTTTAVYQASGTPSPPANGDSPFASCDISSFAITPTEPNYVNTELEPYVAINPTDPSNIIGVYQQDRWSFGGARGIAAAVSHDGGQTWSSTYPHFSICAGGTTTNGGDFQRASDPWVAFSPNGDAYFISLSISFVGDPSQTASGILVSKSTDGGDHWSEPVTLDRTLPDVAPFLFDDKESITADPFNSNYVYAVWDQSKKPGRTNSTSGENSFAFRGNIVFARTTNGGATWEPARVIREHQKNMFSIGNIIRVLPDGTLVDIFDESQGSGTDFPNYDMKVILSHDRGLTWSAPIEVGPERAIGAVDTETGVPIRDGGGLPEMAVDLNPTSPGYGNLYAVWGDTFGSGNTKKRRFPTVVFTQSTDGGHTWSPLVRIDQTPDGDQAFTPTVDVASDGTVAVTYYDFRNNTSDPGMPTDAWMIHCHAGTDCTDPSNWAENHVAGSFDIERAPIARGYFLGDYEGLTSNGTTFLPFFSQTTSTDMDNTYLAVVEP